MKAVSIHILVPLDSDASVRLWMCPAEHLPEMMSARTPDAEPTHSHSLWPAEPNLGNKSSEASPSVWKQSEDAYLEHRIRMLQSSTVATTPRTRRHNPKSSPIFRAAKRRACAGARPCSKTIRTTVQRLCQLTQSLRRWLCQKDGTTYTQNVNPPTCLDGKISAYVRVGRQTRNCLALPRSCCKNTPPGAGPPSKESNGRGQGANQRLGAGDPEAQADGSGARSHASEAVDSARPPSPHSVGALACCKIPFAASQAAQVAIRTEQAYCEWIKGYVHFHGMRSREDLFSGTE